MTSTLWRAPSTLDTTVSKSETVNTKNQPPTASQMPSTVLNIEPTTTTTSSETTTGPHNLPKAGSIVPQPPMPTTMTSSETTTGTHNLPKAGSIVPSPPMPTTIFLETTTGPNNLPKAGSIVPPPPMPVPTVQGATSVPPSGSKMDLPTPQRSCNLVNQVLELGRIYRDKKTKLLVIRDSDGRLAEIATRKRRFVVRQEQLVERKSCLLAELSEVETNIQRGSQDIVGVNEEYRVEGDSTKQYRLEVAHISNCVKDLQKRIKKGVDDMVT
nr:inverted formin-2-like [Leptinotarsa decemlineata]